MRIALSRSVVALAVVSLLAGCAAFPQALSSSSPAPTPSGSTTTPPALTKPALSELVVSPAGLGPIRIGAPVPVESTATAVVAYRTDACDADSASPGLGLWLPSYPDEQLAYGGPGPFSVETKDDARDGVVSRIWVWSSNVSTADGIHPGSSLDEVKAAYPTPDDVIAMTWSTLYVIDQQPGRMIIEVANDPEYWGAAEDGRVLWISVQPITEKAGSPAGTDGAGGCGA